MKRNKLLRFSSYKNLRKALTVLFQMISLISIEALFLDSHTLGQMVTYTYDNASNTTGYLGLIEYSSGATSFSYDDYGRVIEYGKAING